jgi:simple sugar transport system ATP-binding protein
MTGSPPPAGNGAAPVLETRTVSKSFGAVRALRDVSFALRPGEVLGLVGDNGAGKSTLIKCLSGFHRPDTGEILVDGEPRSHLTPIGARELGIETVHQNLSLVDTLDVTQNFFLNREIPLGGPIARLGWLNKRAMYRRTSEVLESLALRISAREPVANLSGGQRQMVAVARAITWGTHIVLLDEPAAALGVRQSLQVLQFVRLLGSRGIAVILISHNMQHVLQATDRIVVLRHGEMVGDVPTARTSARELVTLITGSDLVVPGQALGV